MLLEALLLWTDQNNSRFHTVGLHTRRWRRIGLFSSYDGSTEGIQDLCRLKVFFSRLILWFLAGGSILKEFSAAVPCGTCQISAYNFEIKVKSSIDSDSFSEPNVQIISSKPNRLYGP